MKRLLLISITALLLSPAHICAQRDPEAEKILSAFSEKLQQAPAVHLTFSMETKDLMEGSSSTLEGSVAIKKDKYRLQLPEQLVCFDGKTVYTYLEEVEEITLSYPDPEADDFLSNPQSVFTLHEGDFKTKLIGSGANSYQIDLYPESLNEEFVRIRLLISTEYSLLEAEYKLKSGMIHLLKIQNWDTEKDLADSQFALRMADYPDAEIIDMR